MLDNSAPCAPDGNRARVTKGLCFRQELIIETGRREGAVLRFLPPLIISDTEIDVLLDRFEIAVSLAGVKS